MEAFHELKVFILRKLIRADVWGGKHTPLEFVRKGVPDNFRMSQMGKRTLRGALQELANDGWIIARVKRTGKGSSVHISLNPDNVECIMKFVEGQ